MYSLSSLEDLKFLNKAAFQICRVNCVKLAFQWGSAFFVLDVDTADQSEDGKIPSVVGKPLGISGTSPRHLAVSGQPQPDDGSSEDIDNGCDDQVVVVVVEQWLVAGQPRAGAQWRFLSQKFDSGTAPPARVYGFAFCRSHVGGSVNCPKGMWGGKFQVRFTGKTQDG